MTYAIISLGGKQYRVQEGQRLVVDRLAHDDGKTFHPAVLFVGGDGKADFSPKGTQVTAKVLGGTLGEKIRIGKYKKRTGYRRHTGHRAKLTQIEITAIGAVKTAAKPAAAEKPAAEKPAVAAKPKAAPKPAAAKPATARAAAAKPKAEKPAAKAKPAAKPRAKPQAKAEPPQDEGAE
jgi:large subunit ribosomal protein L21